MMVVTTANAAQLRGSGLPALACRTGNRARATTCKSFASAGTLAVNTPMQGSWRRGVGCTACILSPAFLLVRHCQCQSCINATACFPLPTRLSYQAIPPASPIGTGNACMQATMHLVPLAIHQQSSAKHSTITPTQRLQTKALLEHSTSTCVYCALCSVICTM